jgi:uncharacterized membrane protein
MADIEGLLIRWQSAGVLESGAADRIRAFESEQRKPAGLRWQGVVALVLGAILLACGVILFVSAHWDDFGPAARLAIVAAMVAVFHLGGGLARSDFRGLSTALHAVGTVATGAAIGLVGQIFNMQDHWPAAVLLWALAALAGWSLLRDEAQQALTFLLVPAWIFSELSYSSERHIGQSIYLGRFLFVWAVLYLTLFIGSRRKFVRWILFAAAAISAVVSIALMTDGWRSWSEEQTFVPLSVRIWGWIAIAVVPLIVALFAWRKSLVPVSVALMVAILLPWCYRSWTVMINNGIYSSPLTQTAPTFLAHILVGGFAVSVIWWGVRQASRALVNFGTVGFALVVGWFYFSNVFDKVGRSLGLIGLGVLFLAGGWVLEKMRRRLLGGMSHAEERREVAL